MQSAVQKVPAMWIFPIFFCFHMGRQRQTRQNDLPDIQLIFWLLFLPMFFHYFNLVNFKTSQNDEKWWDCFQSRTVTNTSASGKVEVSQNMAENIWKLKISFRKIVCWSNLWIPWQYGQWRIICVCISKADWKKYNNREENDVT